MVRRLVAVVVLAAALVVGPALLPRRAAAIDNLEYIIPAAVGGVVAIALIVAILMADRTKEPELDFAPAPLPARAPRVQIGAACRLPTGEPALLCW